MNAKTVARVGLGLALAMGVTVPGVPMIDAAGVAQAAPASEVTQATRKARDYLRMMSFSEEGLIQQLQYEGFSESTATRAVRSLGVNWNKQAEAMGRRYLRTMPMSQAQLLEQLAYEGFTDSQIAYARRHIYGTAPKPAPKKPAPVEVPSDRASYSKTQDLCLNYSGDVVQTIVTKGTSCAFGNTILQTYAKAVRANPSFARRTVTFKAYSATTKKTYPVKCEPQQYTRNTDGIRFRIVNCYSGLNYRAKISGVYPIY